MPVDLEDQLRAFGAALMNDSDPITVDELVADPGMHRDDVGVRRPPARRWAVTAAIATAAASLVAIAVVVGHDRGDAVSTSGTSDQQFQDHVLGLDAASPLADDWQVEVAPDSLGAEWGGVDTRRYALDTPTPETGPALDVTTFLEGYVLPGVLDERAPTVTIGGTEATWLDVEQSGIRGLAFLVDGRWFVVRGYRMSDDEIVSAAEHVSLSADGRGAVVDPAGLPAGVVELLVGGTMGGLWPLPADLDGDAVSTIRWTQGDRIVTLLGVPRDDAFVRSLRVVTTSVEDATVGDLPAFVATWDHAPNLRWMGWSDSAASYVLRSNELSSDELVEFANALEPLPLEEWNRLVAASSPAPADLIPVGVARFPLIRDDVAGPATQRGMYGIFAGPSGDRAYPTVELAPAFAAVAVMPKPFSALVTTWGTSASTTIGGRSAATGSTGQSLHVAVDLGDGETLVIESAERSSDELLALAAAVEFVDRQTWDDRYEAIRPVVVDEASAEEAAPATTTAQLGRTMGDGMVGDDVALLQERLISFGFDPGPADGVYGAMTEQAVWAFEKLVMGVARGEATGVVTPEMWAQMQEPLTITPRRSQDAGVDHVEIYLPEQVMVVFHDDQAVLVTHISSGQLDENGEPVQYCETIRVDTGPDGAPLAEPEDRPICGIAKTPGGIFDVDRVVPGTRVGPLGAMWNPIYFNYGIAIHGAKNVPLEPASHGAVRVPMHVSERLPDLIEIGDQVYVWNGVKEPEGQSREDELPVFDWLDPNA